MTQSNTRLYIPSPDDPESPYPRDPSAILLIGADGSNVHMLLTASVDERASRIVLRSLRPLFPAGNGPGCPEAASFYRAGGAPLLKAAASQRMGWDLGKYMLFTLQSVVQVTDLVGGLNILISQSELAPMNEQIGILARSMRIPLNPSLLPEKSGQVIHLNGLQTAAFLTLPDSAGTDAARVRRVLSALKQAMSGKGLRELRALADAVLPQLSTDIPRHVLLSQVLNIRRYFQYSLDSR